MGDVTKLETDKLAATLNKRQIAEAFGVSVPTVDSWVARGCPVVEVGDKGAAYKFDLEAVRRWRDAELGRLKVEQEVTAAAIRGMQAELDLAGGGDPKIEALPFKHRLDFYKSEQQRMDLARQRGFLCETAKVRQDYARTLAYLRDRLQSLPDFLERRCALEPAVVDEIIEAVSQWQEELARALTLPEQEQ